MSHLQRAERTASTSDNPPYRSYGAIVLAFGGLLGGSSALGRRFGRDPQCHTTLDFLLLSAATFKLARTLSHDAVASFLREPLVEGVAHEAHESHQGVSTGERPVRSGGMRQALGELVTCTRCVGTWAAAGLATAQVAAPRFGRMLTVALAGAAVNDWLQAGFSALTSKSNELERRS